MRRLRLAGLVLILAAGHALAERPLLVGVVGFTEERIPGWKGYHPTGLPGPEWHLTISMKRATDAAAKLPAKVGGRHVKTSLIKLDPKRPPDLSGLDVVVLPEAWAAGIRQVDAHARVFHEYVRSGGGLVVFQPNPPFPHPPKAPRPKGYPANMPDPYCICTPAALPYPVTFWGGYRDGDPVAGVDSEHPISRGLSDPLMPFPADETFEMDKRWRILARGLRTGSASLAAATFGRGRIVIVGASLRTPYGPSHLPSDVVVRRSLLWAAGATDDEVVAVKGPDLPPWPNAAASEAIEAGTLRLEVQGSPGEVMVDGRARFFVNLVNKGDQPIWVPRDTLHNLLGVEVTAAGDRERITRWMPKPKPRSLVTSLAVAGHSARPTFVDEHLLIPPALGGLPDGAPHLPPGDYEVRLVLWGDPELKSEWLPLKVKSAALDAFEQSVKARRPNGRLILVDKARPTPDPDGSVERPCIDLAHAMTLARPGDVVYCRPGWYRTRALVVPDDVWLVGAGATRVVITAAAGTEMGSRVELLGSSRLEGVAVEGVDEKRSYLVRALERHAKPTIFQCLLVPHPKDFAAVGVWGGAAPTIRNSVIISPVGDYGVFARHGSRPVIDYCTIISRGFGVGMMDKSVVTIDRSIIAGQCPAIITDDGEFALRESVIWCPRKSKTYPRPIIRQWARSDGPGEGATTVQQTLDDVVAREDVYVQDPGFALGYHLYDYVVPRQGLKAWTLGAFAGEGGKWRDLYYTEAAVSLPRVEWWLGFRPVPYGYGRTNPQYWPEPADDLEEPQ
ncbi:MAG TPA: right-handed parallel beta-helix repeat-containing protein [Phycisphaerae bacterium]|nr:right-handed parallel beta-helix repeat-containing protein [Phycisphaerae bacterium]